MGPELYEHLLSSLYCCWPGNDAALRRKGWRSVQEPLIMIHFLFLLMAGYVTKLAEVSKHSVEEEEVEAGEFQGSW